VANLQKFGLVFLLNTTSFWQFQIAQTKAQTPTFGPLFFTNPIKPITKKIIDISRRRYVICEMHYPPKRRAKEQDKNK
jgi:hypothetical protein